MKKKLLLCLFVCTLALSFAVPTVAAGVDFVDPVNAFVELPVNAFVEPVEESMFEQGFEAFTEQTQLVFAHCSACGRLMMRVWNLTRGRWHTDWMYI